MEDEKKTKDNDVKKSDDKSSLERQSAPTPVQDEPSTLKVEPKEAKSKQEAICDRKKSVAGDTGMEGAGGEATSPTWKSSGSTCVPGDAIVKKMQKNIQMQIIKDELKNLLAGKEVAAAELNESADPLLMVESRGQLSMPLRETVLANKYADVASEGLFEPPCLKEMRINEVVLVQLPSYEADADLKPKGYPCGFANVEKYNETREAERMERKPDPFFIPPDRFVAGVYNRLTCIAEKDDEEEKKKRKKDPPLAPSREQLQVEKAVSPIVSPTVPVSSGGSTAFLKEFFKVVPEPEIRLKKSVAPISPRPSAKAEVVAQPMEKRVDESHLVTVPTELLVDAPFTEGRKMVFFHVKNDGKCSVAVKLTTSDNLIMEVTNACSILHPGSMKLYTAFCTAPVGKEKCSYKSQSITVNYISLDNMPKVREWKSTVLKLNFQLKSQMSTLSEKTEVTEPKVVTKRMNVCSNPFPMSNVNDFSISYKPFDETLKSSYWLCSVSQGSESLESTKAESEEESKTKKEDDGAAVKRKNAIVKRSSKEKANSDRASTSKAVDGPKAQMNSGQKEKKVSKTPVSDKRLSEKFKLTSSSSSGKIGSENKATASEPSKKSKDLQTESSKSDISKPSGSSSPSSSKIGKEETKSGYGNKTKRKP